MKNFKDFSPTPAMLSAARDVLVATAYLDLVSPVVEAYEREILVKGQWSASADLADIFPEGKVILKPKESFMLGDEDAAIFYAQCHAARDRAGLKVSRPDNCPRCEADWTLTQARWRLVDEMESLTGVSRDQALSRGMDDYKRYIELSLCLLMPYLEQSGDAMLKAADYA